MTYDSGAPTLLYKVAEKLHLKVREQKRVYIIIIIIEY
jgi:hypothetical protein